MLIFPIVLIFLMGKSLDGLMSMDKNIFSGKIIYFNIEDASGNKNLQPFYDFSVQFQKDTEAEFIENTNPEEAIELVNKNEAICFILAGGRTDDSGRPGGSPTARAVRGRQVAAGPLSGRGMSRRTRFRSRRATDRPDMLRRRRRLFRRLDADR